MSHKSTTSNRIASIITGSSTRSFSYLASGQVQGDQRNAGTDYTFTYDGIGRMKTASLNGTSVASYIHNGFDQRDEKTVGSTVTDLINDRFGHLMAEANHATGAMIREWMDDKPVPMMDDTGLPMFANCHAPLRCAHRRR